MRIYKQYNKIKLAKYFGKHRKSECKATTKINWIHYMGNFMATHDFVPKGLYGRWNDLVNKLDKDRARKRRPQPIIKPCTIKHLEPYSQSLPYVIT